MKFSRKEKLLLGLFSCTIFVSIYSCSNYKKNSLHEDVSEASISSGEKLAKKYCQSCHMLPDPSLADANSWAKGILPNMGPRLGIFTFNKRQYPSLKYDRAVPANFYPSEPLLKDEEWQDIINYYTSVSPDSLPPQQRQMPIEMKENLFSVSQPDSYLPAPTTCYLKIDTTTRNRTILEGDILSSKLFRYDANLKLIDSIKTSSPVVDIDFSNDATIATDIGIINPNNGSFGKLQKLMLGANGKMFFDSSFGIANLQRPVQSIKTDLNNDGKDDYVICEFGYITGALSWYENKGNDNFDKHILKAIPGAIKIYVKDYNHDGLPDLIVLFAQGDEGISLFTNKGNGQFEEKKILSFPPSYGSSYFEMDDFNNDGFPDILYTCGDNADFSLVLKPYHGVYIFLNDGKYNFTQKYFFPINGCYKAIARDFDGDGDLDIATISFFADYARQPAEGFVYLENKGNFNFKPYSMPQAESGRWLTMEAGDIDGSGKQSILLGNFSIAPLNIASKTNWKKGPSFLVLKNVNTKSK